mgnify:CR=1 FL=1
MEKRTERFYVRVRPSVKTLLEKQCKKDGFDNMTDWFEQFIMEKLKKKRRR